MASTQEQIIDLKRQAIALKEAGDTNGAMALLAQARDLEFDNATVDDIWEPLKLKQFAVVMKKRGDLDAARQALIKAKQIEKEGLAPPEQPSPVAEAKPSQPQPQSTTQEEARPAPSETKVAEPETETPKIQQESTPDIPIQKVDTPEQEIPAPSDNNNNDDGDDEDLKELMQLGQPDDAPIDVAFTIEEMVDHEMMTEFKLGGMPVPSEEEYQARILECKKAALAAKKAGDTTKALKELQKSKQLENVHLALSQMSDGIGGPANNEEDSGWLDNLNAEETELLGELLPNKATPNTPEPVSEKTSDRIEDVLEELAGFLEDPALFMDALDMGMKVPSVEEIQTKAEEQKLSAVDHKKAGDLEGAKAALVKSKQFTAYALKLKTVMEQVERKKGKGSGAVAEVNMEDLEALLEADGKKSKTPPKAPVQVPPKEVSPKEKTSDQLKEEAIRLRDQKKLKEAGEVLKLYKAALQREKDAAEMRRRQELVGAIRKEIDFAQHQIQIFEYYQRFCDPDSQQVSWWKEYGSRCTNVSKLILAKGTGAVKIARKKTTMMSARQTGAEEEDFNALIADLVDMGSKTDPSDTRLEITVLDLGKIQENTNLQKLMKKQKRENLPEHPSTIRLEVHVQLPPNEHDTEKTIDLVIEPSATDPLKNLELTTKDPQPSTCTFDKSLFVELERGNSAYGKIIRRRIERNKKIQISAYHVPVAEKKGWLWSKKNKEELPPPTLLGKVVLEMQGLMTKKCIAAGEFPLMNGSGTKELGGKLKLAVRTGQPFTEAGQSDDKAEVTDEQPICTKLEPYTAMVFSLVSDETEPTATKAEI